MGDETTSEGDVDESNGSGTVTGTHTYISAGVYTVKLVITDDDTGQSNESVFRYIVVYDPSAGFVSQAVAGSFHLKVPMLLTHRSPVRPTSASSPSTRRGLTCRPARLSSSSRSPAYFHSSDYDWLVIAGAKAMYKGTGTINGEGEYCFILSAMDANVNQNDAHTVDRFRIKIWDKATGEIVYDNQMGDADDADAATEIGGGNIVIHKSK